MITNERTDQRYHDIDDCMERVQPFAPNADITIKDHMIKIVMQGPSNLVGQIVGMLLAYTLFDSRSKIDVTRRGTYYTILLYLSEN